LFVFKEVNSQCKKDKDTERKLNEAKRKKISESVNMLALKIGLVCDDDNELVMSTHKTFQKLRSVHKILTSQCQQSEPLQEAFSLLSLVCTPVRN
jgi:uncharacterized protein YbcV (DUF1398 family)